MIFSHVLYQLSYPGMSWNVGARLQPGLVSPDADRGFLVNMNRLVQRCGGDQEI